MLRDIIVDPHFPDCPIRNILTRISDRWSMLILLTLNGKQEPMRYSDILAAIPDISQKMLTVALKNLEADGLVERHAFAEIPPRVEYNITQRAKTLMPHINSLVEWALDNLADILNDRKKFSSNKKH
ncbi:MAG: helix-turn-helix transcriptional regulator [Muribaculaceae bacterium]|nr:helix-turn-helix transcriptional regulator [Muribaculaceae bacterium]